VREEGRYRRGAQGSESFSLDNQVQERSPIPYHPGALKYFKEKGIGANASARDEAVASIGGGSAGLSRWQQRGSAGTLGCEPAIRGRFYPGDTPECLQSA